MNKPKRKWWLRYSLKFFLVMLTMASVVFGLYIRYKKPRADELAAFEKLSVGEGDYLFGYQLSDELEPPGPKWIRQLFNDDHFFARVKTLNLTRSRSSKDGVAIKDLDGVEVFEQLETLSVEDSDIEDVSAILKLRKLRNLQLHGAPPNCNLASIGDLSQLTSLSIRSQTGTQLPLESFRGHPSLESLSVHSETGYTKITDIDALASIPNLGDLSFEGCEFETGDSPPLEVDLSQTQLTVRFPELSSLNVLKSRGLASLGPLSSAPVLETLTLTNCEKLDLSDPNINFPQLTYLKVDGCQAVKNLDGFKNSKRLRTVLITSCPLDNTQSLGGKDHLQTLKLINLNQLESLDGMPLKSLQTFHIDHCWNLKLVGVLAGTKLKHLDVKGNVDGESLKQCVRDSKETLKSCVLHRCMNLTDLDFLHDCSNLESLSIQSLDNLTRIGSPKSESVMKLTDLKVRFCDKLQSLDGIEAFNTTTLDIHQCKKIQDVSQIANLSRLESLNLISCRGITTETTRKLASELSIEISNSDR